VDEAIRAAESFAVLFPGSDLQPHADAIERGALARRVQSGTARPADRMRLAELVAEWTKGRTDLPPKDALALGDLLAAAENYDEAAKQYLRCVNAGVMDVENAARIGLAHVAISRQDFTQALGHLDAVRGEAADRLDVNMLRCQLWRAQNKPREAIGEYLPMLQALNRTDPEHGDAWWGVAEATGQAYVEAGLIDEAREFLEGVRKKDKTFGGDPKRRARFLTFMRRLDLRR
jgi:tetratricopeptide (TPR) repeat protein